MTWSLAAIDHDGLPTPFQLMDSTYLFAGQTLGIRRSRRDGNLWLTTLRHLYQWQRDGEDGSWIIRWGYDRERKDRYPGSHVHVNAASPTYRGSKDFHKLHLPSGRVMLETLSRS